jgi:two-component system, cell cycle response regulator DivK
MATILIAEDNSDIRQLTKLQLQKSGFTCTEATNGKEVLELLPGEKIDLILMDINMPELDGWETTMEIRTKTEYSEIPIIAMTAYSLEGDRARAKAAGCNAFHSKPVDFDRLLNDINRLLQPEGQLDADQVLQSEEKNPG